MSSTASEAKAAEATPPWRGFRTGLWPKAIDVEYELADVQSPSAEAVERAVASFRAAGLKAY